MYYSRDYNMLICLSNNKPVGLELPSPASLSSEVINRLALQYQQNLLSAQSTFQVNNLASTLSILRNNSLELIKRNQTVFELEQLKVLVDKMEAANLPLTMAFNNLGISPTVATTPIKPESLPIITEILKPKTNIKLEIKQKPGNFADDKNEFLLSSGRRPDTPSSPFSDVSSGLGTMTPPERYFVSPLNIEPLQNIPTTPEHESELTSPDIGIEYQGRNLLDLHHNMTYQWSFQMAVLPQQDLITHFEYRSLYHRLSDYGAHPEFDLDQCPFCEFEYAVPLSPEAILNEDEFDDDFE